MNKTTFYLFIFVLVGCQVNEKKSDRAFFSGEIVNPTNDYIVLYKDEEVVDSALLDENNRFVLQLDSVEEGLYHFDHSPELQYVYLGKGDSILIRLNTSDFDESLVFSGTGEEINNFLLEMFLAFEEEDSLINSLYELEPAPFATAVDSLRMAKHSLLTGLEKDIALSDKAKELATANIDYTYYAYFEKYPFKHRRKVGDKLIHDLPADFYGYRKNVDYNNANLSYFRPYYNYMIFNMGNMSYMECLDGCPSATEKIASRLHFNLHKLKLIDSLVKDGALRDNLFRNVALDYLLKARDNSTNNTAFITDFRQRSAGNKHKNEIDRLYNGIQGIQPDSPLPDVTVHNIADKTYSLREVANDGKVVFYFWSGLLMPHFMSINQKVEELKLKHPDYEFIGISYKTDLPQWKGLLQNYGLDPKEQFLSTDFEELTNSLIVYPLNKCMVVHDGKIVDGFADIHSLFRQGYPTLQ
tara:strand:- start:79173 stop:80579 length:1407 start_codon:yes stop_codon:yes gene_type:complete